MKKFCLLTLGMVLLNYNQLNGMDDLNRIKASYSTKDSNGITLLMRAAEEGNKDVVDTAIKVGASLNDQDRWKQTALYYAARAGQEQIVAALINAKADLNLADADNNTPLMIALQAFPVTSTHKAIASKLIDAQANLKIANNKKQTALSIAAAGGLEDIVKKLVGGSDLNAKDAQGRTPLMLAIAAERVGKDKRYAIAKSLVDERANVTAQDDQGKTALMWAAEQGLADVAEIILKRDPTKVNEKDKRGKTALDYAEPNSAVASKITQAGGKKG